MKKNIYKYRIFIIAVSVLGAFVIFALVQNNLSENERAVGANQPVSVSAEPTTATRTSLPTATAPPTSTPEQNNSEQERVAVTQPPRKTPSPVPTQAAPIILDPENWKAWPVLPIGVSDNLREVYQEGLAKGNNPKAFSILGDCNSEPDVFMGLYDHENDLINQLAPNLQETIHVFKGSFDRYSPTVKDGTSEGALLWADWNDNEEGYCEENETPIDCELRVHKPSIAFINLGTHYENRNEDYLRVIIGKLLDNGTVPIIVTKADNRERDERINQTLVKLASEHDLPVWNFWRSVQDVPDQGILGELQLYLNDEALEIQRTDGLMVLDIIYRDLQK